MLISLSIVTLLLMVVGVVAARRSRKRFIWEGDTFRCRFRACRKRCVVWPGLARHCTRRWSRPMWARWADDVLMVRRGPLLPRTISLRGQMCPAGVYDLPPHDPRGLGGHPIAARLRLDDGSFAEVATARYERMALVGPYLVAAVSDAQRIPPRDTDFNVQARRPNDHEEGWQ